MPLLLLLSLLAFSCHRPPTPATISQPATIPAPESTDASAAGDSSAPVPEIGNSDAAQSIDLAELVPGPPQPHAPGYLFTLVAADAQTVAVAGSFNGWMPTRDLLRRHGDLWYGVVEIPLGRHRYRFLIDGTRWVLDPDNPRQSKDEMGNLASLLVVVR